MKVSDYAFAIVLICLAIGIWARDTTWINEASDTLPILVALPLFIWLCAPWKFTDLSSPPSALPLVTCAVLFLFGVILNLTLILAAAWVFLLWTWLAPRVEASMIPRLRKLLVLPLMAFPWVTLDLQPVGWWFRLSGAWITEHLFSALGSTVSREGTQLMIDDLSVSVAPACAGMNVLQSLLIAGSVLAYILLGHSSRYWWNLTLLLAIAWVSNTLRILALTIAAVLVDAEFAMGVFHRWGGWLVLCTVFGLSYFLFSYQGKRLQGGVN